MHIVATVTVQLALFALTLWLHSSYGHAEGQQAAVNVAPGAQVLISTLFIAASTAHQNEQRAQGYRRCLFAILAIYHTVVLPVSVGTAQGPTRTIAYEGAIGGSLLVFNLLAYYYTFLGTAQISLISL